MRVWPFDHNHTYNTNQFHSQQKSNKTVTMNLYLLYASERYTTNHAWCLILPPNPLIRGPMLYWLPIVKDSSKWVQHYLVNHFFFLNWVNLQVFTLKSYCGFYFQLFKSCYCFLHSCRFLKWWNSSQSSTYSPQKLYYDVLLTLCCLDLCDVHFV